MKPRLMFVSDSLATRCDGGETMIRVAREAGGEFDIDLVLLSEDEPGGLREGERGLFRSVATIHFPGKVSLGGMSAQRHATNLLRKTVRSAEPDAIVSFSLRSALRVARAAGPVPTAWVCRERAPLFGGPIAGAKCAMSLQTLASAGTRIVCRSKCQMAWFRGRGVPETRLALVRDGLNLEGFATPRPLARKSGDGDAALSVVCQAPIEPAQNHRLLIRALAESRDRGVEVRVACVGRVAPDRAEYAKDLVRDAAILNVGDLIEWHEPGPDTDSLFAGADAAVLPGDDDTADLSLAAAGAAGLPLIGTRAGGIAELVREDVSGIPVDGRNPGELADAFVRLAENSDLRRFLGGGARDLVRREFDSARQNRRWAEFLGGLASARELRAAAGVSALQPAH